MISTNWVMVGSYDYGIVVLSVLISLFAATVVLAFGGRITATRGRVRLVWMIGGALSSGVGTWSMHFTALRAFNLPVEVFYDWPTVVLSLLPAVFAAAVALHLVSRQETKSLRTLAGGIFMGGGIAATHYTAMASMRLPAICHYSAALVTLSVLLAIIVSLAPMRLTSLRQKEESNWGWRTAVGIIMLGAANPVMHFTGMAAATFTRSAVAPDLSHAISINTIGLRVFAIIPLLILTVALVASLVDGLHKQSALLDRLFEQAPQAVALTNSDNQVIRVNREFTKMFGYSSLEAVGRHINELIVPEELQVEFRRLGGLTQRGERVEVETVRRRKDGSRLQVYITPVPVSLSSGQYVVYKIFRDITERKRAEESLRESEERFRTIFENAAVGTSLVDTHGHPIKCNPAIQKMLGYTENELRGMVFTDFTHPDDRDLDWALYRELVAGKRDKYEIEKRYIKKDGQLTWGHLIVSLVRDKNSAAGDYTVGMVEDITERKRAERALRRSEAYLAAGQKLSRTGSWALTLSSGDLFWSEETYRIFGFDPATTSASVKETFLSRIHPDDCPSVEQGLREAASQRGSYAIEYRIVLPNGSTRYIHDEVYPATSEAGEIIERYGVIMDVTDRKRAEEELQVSRDQLRALAARLQSVREEERTRVAREIHDDLGQALTAIKIDLSSLCHDLTAEKKQKSESVLKLIDQTIQSVRRISTELRPGVLDDLGLVAAIEWAAEEFEARTGTKCRLDLPQNDITADPESATALFRIFQETLTNVARHAHATEVEVRLAKANGSLELETRDNGNGVNSEHVSDGKSLGILGMRERALLLGGELTIAGAAGQGTTVRVSIPEARRNDWSSRSD